MVRGMVKQTSRCRGIRHVNDGLIAWCLTYEDGPLGMLQTIEVGLFIVSNVCVPCRTITLAVVDR